MFYISRERNSTGYANNQWKRDQALYGKLESKPFERIDSQQEVKSTAQ